MMSRTFNCPSCGAPINYGETEEEIVRCSFCGTEVRLPEEQVQVIQQKKLGRQGKWVLIGIILLFVVPACLGFGGTMLGVIVSLFTAILGIIAPFIALIIQFFLGK